MIVVTPGQLRLLTIGLGIGNVVFGVVSTLAPRWFAKVFGLPISAGPAGAVAIQAVGVRDTISGVGLTVTALQGGRVAPWLLTRLIADATDAVSVAFASRGEARSSRLGALGAIALGAATTDLILYLWHRAETRRR